ncbi:cupin domain-containing protein [Herbiconiux ginsengi]|uniref:Cupin superfamily protein n=1 Tax=Herbiconiux ginsengi TaxID=381665 RepID=A0A1H3RKH3_9MICO|nr:cupin domain-containing protein [Herbiconiux ginsengi]SDZ25738.1 Cupin superfamily protein [Herbiconiux ginsengi]
MTIEIERGSETRPALSRCISVAPDEFARDHWGRRPLLSPASSLPGAFDDLFSERAVDELITERGLRTPFIRMAQEGSVLATSAFTAPGGFGAEVGDQVSSEKVLAEFADGATIVLQGLHRLWPPLIDFTRHLVDDLGHPAQVNAYVTPASSRGFDPHYDVHDVFVLQIAGEKHWRIHSPVHPDPLRDQPWGDHRDAVAREARNPPVIDAVLQPGDALYLPRGWLHSAEALGGTSVHLTVGVAAYTRADVVRALVSTLGEVPALRASLPLGIDLSDPEALRPLVDETVADLVRALTAIPDASDAVANAVAPPGFRAADPAATVARQLAARFADATRPEPLAPLATVDAIAALDASSLVRWRGSLATRIEDSGDRVRIVTPTKTVALPREAEATVRRLHGGGFGPGASPDGAVALADFPGLDLDDAIVVARRLLREGILVPAG